MIIRSFGNLCNNISNKQKKSANVILTSADEHFSAVLLMSKQSENGISTMKMHTHISLQSGQKHANHRRN